VVLIVSNHAQNSTIIVILSTSIIHNIHENYTHKKRRTVPYRSSPIFFKKRGQHHDTDLSLHQMHRQQHSAIRRSIPCNLRPRTLSSRLGELSAKVPSKTHRQSPSFPHSPTKQQTSCAVTTEIFTTANEPLVTRVQKPPCGYADVAEDYTYSDAKNLHEPKPAKNRE
jgi:hypothetical protein